MTEFINWFERKFSFDDLPLWMFPCIVERLRGTPARIEDRVRSLSADLLTKRAGDSWSIQEHVGHLWDLEDLWLGRVEDFREGRETLRPADLENRKTHEAEHNARPAEELLSGFRSSREALVRRFESAGGDFVAKSALHPRLQTPMRVLDLAFFVAEHDDHHLARITELIRKLG